MILVTLGTQDKKFYRILGAIQKQIDKGNIKGKVIVQAGCSCDFKSNDMEIFDLKSMDEMEDIVKKCDLLITHGGVGSIITGLKYNKKIIAAARLKKYKEHTNDHQIQIIENFSRQGYICALEDYDDFDKILKKTKNFKPKKYKSNNKNFTKLIDKEIIKYL